MGWMNPPTIPSNLVRVLENVELWQFGVLTSRMHMAWLRYIGGRLKSDYRYSIGLVYNTFPWADPNNLNVNVSPAWPALCWTRESTSKKLPSQTYTTVI